MLLTLLNLGPCRESVNIPVIANGNILYHEDIHNCLSETKADGVMSAEGHLYNPLLFLPPPTPSPVSESISSNTESTQHPLVTTVAREYLDIVKTKVPGTKYGHIKGHLFKILRPALKIHTDIRTDLGKSYNIDHAFDLVERLDALVKVRSGLNKFHS